MKFINEYHRWEGHKPTNEKELVSESVRKAISYEAGQLEAVQQQLERLTEIVGLLFVHLPDDKKIEVADAMGYVLEGVSP